MVKPTQPVAAEDPDTNELADIPWNGGVLTPTSLTTQGAKALLASSIAFAGVAMTMC